MITDTDITKLKSVFATKADLKAFSTKKELGEEIVGVRVEIGEVSDKLDSVALAVGRIENAVDGLSGAIQDLRNENSMGSIHLARHDRQIEALAIETKITLPH